MSNVPGKRFLSIRLSQEEFDKVQVHLERSACRSLTEYVKKVLTRQPVIIKLRDQSREEVLHRLGVIKSQLDGISGVVVDPAVLGLLKEIKTSIREIGEKCSH